MSIELNNEQVFALYEGENWWNRSSEQIFEICGAAGTGKTTLVKFLIDRFGLEMDEVLFLAYMGKAAMALARNGLPARTIHSAIYDFEKILDRDENGKIQFTESGKPKTKFVFVKKDKIYHKIRLIVVDEGYMVNEQIAKDLISFGVPIIVLGDQNQLKPIFGNSFFLKNPNITLTEIMRQAQDNPIIYLSQVVLNGGKLKKGIYGNCAVVEKNQLDEFMFKDADVILTGTNRLRYEINTLFREHLLDNIKLDYPNVGEKLICRRNNWSKCLDENIYLINGMTGYVSHVDKETFTGKMIKIDFQPDFMTKKFKNLAVDYEALYASPDNKDEAKSLLNFSMNKFEFGYAITVHLSQGSQYDKVLFMTERMSMNDDDYKRYLYTGITRAREKITIAV